MVQFIEKHRRLLQAYCLVARIIGWFLILGGIFWFFAVVRNMNMVEVPRTDEQRIDVLLYITYSLVYDFLIPGILAFAIMGLLDYLLRPKVKPPLILGMTDKLCYLYAIFLILRFFSAINYFGNPWWFVNFKFFTVSEMSVSTRLLLVQPLLGPTLAKVLLLIGVGTILHRLLPVIEESKTLV
jgi:hypothetical protein